MGCHLGWHGTLRRHRKVTSFPPKKMKKKLTNATTLDNVPCTEVLRRPDEIDKILKWRGFRALYQERRRWFPFLITYVASWFFTKQVRIAVKKNISCSLKNLHPLLSIKTVY
jgi:hypothetical protein